MRQVHPSGTRSATTAALVIRRSPASRTTSPQATAIELSWLDATGRSTQRNRGAGIGRLPDFHAAAAIAAGTLVRLLPEYDDDTVDVHALYPSHRSLSAKIRVFIDVLAEHLNRTEPLALLAAAV